MKRIFALMILFGLAIGLAFPYVIDPFVIWNPGDKMFFRLACLAAGFAVGAFCYFLVKVTLYQRNLMLASIKKEWETSFDALTEGVVLVDARGFIVRVNSSFAAVFGTDTAGLLGQPATELARRRGWGDNCLIERALHSGTSHKGEGATGGRTFEQSADPILDGNGKVTGCVGVLRDVTEERKLRQQLIQSARMVSLGHFVAGAAHEINNPLTGVIALCQLLLRGEHDEKTRLDIETIQHEGQRAAGIVSRLLSFVGEQRMEPVVFDVNHAVNQVLEDREAVLAEHGIGVEREFFAGPLPVLADPDQFREVMTNIIDNARYAIAGCGMPGRLVIRTIRTASGRGRIHLLDDGPGVPEDIREHIFDPFFTTRAVGEGTGLGLSSCYSIVKECGGRIWLEESNAPGAHFIVELPLEEAKAA